MNQEMTGIAVADTAPPPIAVPRVAAAPAVERRAALNWSAVLAAVSLGSFVLVHIAIDALRRLSFDEAYYLAAARRGVPWSIDDHPPMLGVLLWLSDRITGGPVELRVRITAIVMLTAAAIGLGALASMLSRPAARARAFAIAATLGTWGLIPAAGGAVVFPDAPFLAALSWLLFLATWCVAPVDGRSGALEERRAPVLAGLALLAALAVASKATAVPCVGAVALGLVLRGRWRAAAATAAGGMVMAPLAIRSLVAQSAHVVGMGPFVSQPRIGSLASLAIIAVATFLVFSPPALLIGARAPSLRLVPGGRLIVVFIIGALVASAVISGRIPEVHWFMPASVPLYVAAAAALAERGLRTRVAVLTAHAVPAIVGVTLWALPIRAVDSHADFFASVPHVAFSPIEPSLPWVAGVASVRSVPVYGRQAWLCVYGEGAGREGQPADRDLLRRPSPQRREAQSSTAAAACRWLADPSRRLPASGRALFARPRNEPPAPTGAATGASGAPGVTSTNAPVGEPGPG